MTELHTHDVPHAHEHHHGDTAHTHAHTTHEHDHVTHQHSHTHEDGTEHAHQ
ncbi:MAG: zinc transporter Slc39a7, partial [Mycobacterium sp.]